MSRTRWLQAGLAGLILAVLVGGIAVAGGRTTSPSSAKQDKQRYAEMYLDRLAARLGIPRDRLTEAGKQAAEDVIAQALKDGAITQADATRLRERIQSFNFGSFFGGRFGKRFADHAELGSLKRTVMDALAAKLGMTTGALLESLRSGTSVAELARTKGISLATLGAAVADAVKPVLDGLVKDAKLSQERAANVLARIRSGEYFNLRMHRQLKRAG